MFCSRNATVVGGQIVSRQRQQQSNVEIVTFFGVFQRSLSRPRYSQHPKGLEIPLDDSLKPSLPDSPGGRPDGSARLWRQVTAITSNESSNQFGLPRNIQSKPTYKTGTETLENTRSRAPQLDCAPIGRCTRSRSQTKQAINEAVPPLAPPTYLMAGDMRAKRASTNQQHAI